MDSNVVPLRERQAQQVRSAVLEAALAQLESKAVEDMSMAALAESAGISLRTLYRYCPDRNSLLQAAGEQLYRSLGKPVAIPSGADIAGNFREAARRLATRPKLVRALVRTNAGRIARSAVRPQRLEAIRAALETSTAGLDPQFIRRATALIAHLCSASSWVNIADESDLADEQAQ